MIPNVVIYPDWVVVYNAVVLTSILITQIYLDISIALAQRRQIKEKREELKKQLAAATAAAEKQNSGPHEVYH